MPPNFSKIMAYKIFGESVNLPLFIRFAKNNPAAAPIDGLRQELAYFIFELRPPAPEQKNLLEALQTYVAEWSRQSGILAKVNVRDKHHLAGTLAKDVDVSNILSKLHLADRTQAAVLAWREGVVRKQ